MKSLLLRESSKRTYCFAFFDKSFGEWCINDTFNFKRKKDAEAMARVHYPNCKVKILFRKTGNWQVCR